MSIIGMQRTALRAACWPPAAAEPAARTDGPTARSSAANPVSWITKSRQSVGYRRAIMVWLQRKPEFCRIVAVCLSGSVIAVAAFLFLLASVRGADAVSTMPRWLWWCIILYTGNAIGISAWLLKAAANNGAPPRPRPRARQA